MGRKAMRRNKATIRCLKEITVWPEGVGYKVPNHTYLVRDNSVLAYQNAVNGNIVYFDTPIKMDHRGRTFVEVQMIFERSKITL